MRQGERHQQIEQPEDDQGGQHLDFGMSGIAVRKTSSNTPSPPGAWRGEGGGKRGQEDREDHQEAGDARVRKREIDDAGRAQESERRRDELARDDPRPRIFEVEGCGTPAA